MNQVKQWSPTFLAPGNGFMEDNFPADGGRRGMVQAVMRVMGRGGERFGAADEASLAGCSPLAVRPGS